MRLRSAGALGALALLTLALPAAGAGAQHAPAQPAPPVAQKPTVTIGWVGDIALDRGRGLPPDGGRHLFSSVAPYLRCAGWLVGNLEGTLGRGGPGKCGRGGGGGGTCFAFQAPASYARLLRRAGFRLMNDANNHFHDHGGTGERQTLVAQRRAHLLHTGRPGEIAVARIRGVRVAFVGFAPYPWAASLTDIGGARRLVARAARRAKLVVVIVHAGAEGAGATHVPHGTEHAFGENRGNVRAFAHAVVNAGADLVLGSGPHVLRGIECYRRRAIAYSLGDFVGYHTLSTAGVQALSGVLSVRLGPGGALRGGRLLPVRLVGPGVPRRDPGGASIAQVRRLSRADFGRRACRISHRGAIALP